MSVSLLQQVVAGRAPEVLPLTVEQYHRMIALGILREGEPTELIDGVLVRKDRSDRGGNPLAHGPRHSLTLKRLERLLRPVEACGCHLHLQLPVTLAGIQEPEPDLAVVRGSPEDYQGRHPGPQDLVAVIEVADSTLDYDRTTKQRLYAAAGISPYWIINLPEGQIEVYDQPLPQEGRYAVRTAYQPGQTVPLRIAAAPPVEVAVAQVLPPVAAQG
jgi:Uma2 family endonuclease